MPLNVTLSDAREGDVRPGQGDVAVVRRHGALVAALASGQHVTLTERYLEESTSLGYALTVFRSQGVTVDHSFLLADDTLFQEAGYPALSRGWVSNHLFAVAPYNPRAEIAHGQEDLRAATPWPGSPSCAIAPTSARSISAAPGAKPVIPHSSKRACSMPSRPSSPNGARTCPSVPPTLRTTS